MISVGQHPTFLRKIAQRLLVTARQRCAVLASSGGTSPPNFLLPSRRCKSSKISPRAPEVEEEVQELVDFPATAKKDGTDAEKVTMEPVLLNSKEHVVGYLSRILNATVYDAAIETELQYATNVSTVR